MSAKRPAKGRRVRTKASASTAQVIADLVQLESAAPIRVPDLLYDDGIHPRQDCTLDKRESSGLSCDQTDAAVALPNVAETKTRRRTVPIAPWWAEMAKARIEERKARDPEYNQRTLAAKLKEQESDFANWVNGKKHPAYEFTLALSDELGLPYPAILPESYAEALELTKHKRLRKSSVQVAGFKPGVAENTQESQTDQVVSLDGKGRRKPKQRQSRV